MFRRIAILALIFSTSLFNLSGCAYIPPVQQGNILTDADIQTVHQGMTQSDIQAVLGKPLLIDLYHDNQLVYIYTLKFNHKTVQKRQLLIYFRAGRVINYEVSSSPNLIPPT